MEFLYLHDFITETTATDRSCVVFEPFLFALPAFYLCDVISNITLLYMYMYKKNVSGLVTKIFFQSWVVFSFSLFFMNASIIYSKYF